MAKSLKLRKEILIKSGVFCNLYVTLPLVHTYEFLGWVLRKLSKERERSDSCQSGGSVNLHNLPKYHWKSQKLGEMTKECNPLCRHIIKTQLVSKLLLVLTFVNWYVGPEIPNNHWIVVFYSTSTDIITYIPYARHYNPRFVYFLPHIWRPFFCFQGGFFHKILSCMYGYG